MITLSRPALPSWPRVVLRTGHVHGRSGVGTEPFRLVSSQQDAGAKKAPQGAGLIGFVAPVTRWIAVSSFRAVLGLPVHAAIGTSRFHEHLNFPAETLGATAPASIARPACSSTRCVVPDNHKKFA